MKAKVQSGQSCHGRKNSVIRELSVVAALLVTGGWLAAAELTDFKFFAAEERYRVEGVPIVLTQIVGEVTVKLKTTTRPAEVAETLTAANGAQFKRERALSGGLGMYKLQSAGPASESVSQAALDSLNQHSDVEYGYPVYANAATGLRHLLYDQIVVRLQAPADVAFAEALASLKVRLGGMLSAEPPLYVLQLTEPKSSNPLRVCEALRQQPGVVWAEPNMAQEAQEFVVPNDTYFANEWHLRNTGQFGAFSDADVDADQAWDGSQGYGSPGIRIAVLDVGVQTDHPDLAGNLVAGYDFYSNDDDPDPAVTYDNHGTAVAGTAAAAVNNSLGVAGVAGKCMILPLRIAETLDSQGHIQLADNVSMYRALIYAADNGDVINISWGSFFNGTIYSGLSYAYSYGRAGKGCVTLCASGNSAGGDGDNSYTTLHSETLYPTLPAGNYFFGFAYVKDGSGSGNDDCFWLADIRFPSGARERLDSPNLPLNWVTLGDANWTGSIDPVHAHGTTRYAWRSGVIGDNQYSLLVSPLATLDAAHPTLSFRTWISSQNLDQAQLWVFNDQSQRVYVRVIGQGLVANRTTVVAFPASQSTVLGVGASSDFDYRSHFSQYDSTLDFVAPGGGGYAGIATTDRTGNAGYVEGDYVETEGTSFSAPTAAGIAALVLSKDGNLTRATVADKLIQNCDKVGPVAYTGSPSRNDYYGYGRLNAYASVNATTADTTAPTFSSATVMHFRAVDVAFSEPMGDGVLTPGNYSITAGAGTLSSNPAKVIRITPSIYRLLWTAGDMATSGTVTIAASSAIKDAAGNALTGTLSRSSTGTKRVVAVNGGGNPNASSGHGSYYTPPFIADNGFQGNEANPLLTFTSEMAANYWFSGYPDTSGVTDPAPSAVYQTARVLYYSDQVMTYSIPVPSGSYKLRLHFCQNYQSLRKYVRCV